MGISGQLFSLPSLTDEVRAIWFTQGIYLFIMLSQQVLDIFVDLM